MAVHSVTKLSQKKTFVKLTQTLERLKLKFVE